MTALEILTKLIKDSEGCKLTAYQCPAGVWTVGYGCTGADIKKGLTWTQAQAQAVSFGGNLVTVNDAAENQFLVNTFGNLNRWIGLTDEVVEGQFKWVNGEAVTYTNWIP
jgi:GH24 family phage-related lysozyme (muramidase)